jgi:hypothetical protein
MSKIEFLKLTVSIPLDGENVMHLPKRGYEARTKITLADGVFTVDYANPAGEGETLKVPTHSVAWWRECPPVVAGAKK